MILCWLEGKHSSWMAYWMLERAPYLTFSSRMFRDPPILIIPHHQFSTNEPCLETFARLLREGLYTMKFNFRGEVIAHRLTYPYRIHAFTCKTFPRSWRSRESYITSWNINGWLTNLRSPALRNVWAVHSPCLPSNTHFDTPINHTCKFTLRRLFLDRGKFYGLSQLPFKTGYGRKTKHLIKPRKEWMSNIWVALRVCTAARAINYSQNLVTNWMLSGSTRINLPLSWSKIRSPVQYSMTD